MVLEQWLLCRSWLLPALDPADATEQELLAELASGRAQLWSGNGAALVTHYLGEGAERSLHVWLAGGRLAEILAMRTGVEAWARTRGCKEISIDGRKGWSRVLRPHGYAVHGAELRRKL